MRERTRRAKPWLPQARSDVPTYLHILRCGCSYRPKRPRSRLPIIVARVWPPRKRDFPLFPLPIKPGPCLRTGLHRDGATPSFSRGGRQTHAFDFRRSKVEFKADVIVLGAGMVGVSAALH